MKQKFDIVNTGTSANAGTNPATPRGLKLRGGDVNPTASALKEKFPAAVVRTDVVWGDTVVYVTRESVREVMQWLHDEERYEYLSDVTGVEYRDFDTPVEVVWHLRSLSQRRFIRIKTAIPRGEELSVPSVWHLWKGADWLERECYDMFGIKFEGHPDLRRILMWESYKEGFPLRKDFPLRGRFARGEQLRQALAQNVENRYSMEELSIADAFEDLPSDMRQRLGSGERTGE